MKVGVLIERLKYLRAKHGDVSVFMDVDERGLRAIGEVDVDAEDTGIILWASETEAGATVTCPACGLVYEAGGCNECPACMHEWPEVAA